VVFPALWHLYAGILRIFISKKELLGGVMKKFLILILLSVLMVMLFTNCEQEKKEQVSEDMFQQIAMLPGDAEAIAYLNIDKIEQSTFFDMFMDSVADNPFHDEEYMDFVKQTGFNFKKDLHEIYLTSGIKNHDDPAAEAFIMVKGTFDPEKLVNFLKENDEKDKIESVEYEGYTFYTVEDAKKSFCFYDNSTLIAGSQEMMKEWIKNTSGTESRVTPEILARINALKFKNSAWFTVKADQITKNLKNDKFKKIKGIEDLKAMSVSMDFSDQFQLDGHSEFKNEETAKLFKEAVKGLIATGKLSVSDDRDIIDILNAINVDSDDNNVSIDLKLSQEEIQKLMDKRNFLPRQII
jgi:hypothetical protein